MICGILEIEIMNSMWTLTEQDDDRNISVADIVEHLKSVNIERAYTTIKTVMDRLTSKDMLVRYRNEKKFFYRSTLDREEMARETLKEISNHFFKGSQVEMLRFIEKECESHLAY